MAHEYIVAGIATALRAGALTSDAVALEARKAAEAEDGAPPRPCPLRNRLKAASFPRNKSLREFDFEANPNIDPATMAAPRPAPGREGPDR